MCTDPRCASAAHRWKALAETPMQRPGTAHLQLATLDVEGEEVDAESAVRVGRGCSLQQVEQRAARDGGRAVAGRVHHGGRTFWLVMGCAVVAYKVMAYIVMAHIGLAYIVMACIVPGRVHHGSRTCCSVGTDKRWC